jgi:hypothetical protein
MGEISRDELEESSAGQVCYYDANGRLVCTSSEIQMLMQSPGSDLDAAIDALRSFQGGSARQRLAIDVIGLLQKSASDPSSDVTERVVLAVRTLLNADTPVRVLLFVSELQEGNTGGSQSTSAY